MQQNPDSLYSAIGNQQRVLGPESQMPRILHTRHVLWCLPFSQKKTEIHKWSQCKTSGV